MADQGQTPSSDGAIWVFMAIVAILSFTIIFHIGIYARPIAFIRGLEVHAMLYLPFFTDSFREYLQLLSLKLQVIGDNPDIVKGAKLFEVNDEAGKLMTWVFIPIFSFFSYKMLIFKRHRKTRNMADLRLTEGRYWGRTSMFSKVKLDTVNLRGGDWGIAMKPNEFALDKKFWDKEKGTFNLPLLEEVLIAQIGRPFHTKKGIPDDIRILLKKLLTKDELRLLVLFMIRVQAAVEPEEGEKAQTSKYQKIAESMIHKLGIAYSDDDFKKLDNEINDYFMKYGNSEIVRGVACQHYYVTTFFAGMLAKCRETGVFASSDFLWMKKCNRTLWYLLNNMGRKVGWAECAGPWSHYLGEAKAGKSYKQPNIQGAVEGFALYLTRK